MAHKKFNPEMYEKKFRRKTIVNKEKAAIKERIEKEVLNKPTEKDIQIKRYKDLRRENLRRLVPTSAKAVVSKVPSYRKSRIFARGALSLVSGLGVSMPVAAAGNPYQLGKGQGRQYAKAGRPRGTYKYGNMPIQEFKKLQAKRRAVQMVMSQQEQQRLSQSGYSPQEIQQIQLRKAVTEQVSSPLPAQEPTQVQIPVQDSNQNEIDFERAMSEANTSPNTLMMLQRLKDIQNKGQRDDINQQRIHRERRLLSEAGNLMKTPSMFKHNPAIEGDWLGNNSPNILQAENIFKKPNDIRVGAKRRFNILSTREAGNDLKFF